MKNLRSITLLIFCVTTLFPIANEALKFNLISHSLANGAGKEVDVAILTEELEKLGHQVSLCDFYLLDEISPADVNIFLAQLKTSWMTKARLNWYIPNPEVCLETVEDLKKLDLILCKTKLTQRIFSPICAKTRLIGFRSLDHYDQNIAKKYHKCLHVAGKSKSKGTTNVLNVWRSHPTLPFITIIQHHPSLQTSRHSNHMVIRERIPFEELLVLQNECALHLCPSRAEGFGHYIMEGMSTKAVVVTTDAPPMNEFIRDKRCLVACSSSKPRNYSTSYTVDEEDLYQKVKALSLLSKEELQQIGERNRKEFLRRSRAFKHAFCALIEETDRRFLEKEIREIK